MIKTEFYSIACRPCAFLSFKYHRYAVFLNPREIIYTPIEIFFKKSYC